MNVSRWSFTPLILAVTVMFVCSVGRASSLDRDYKLGDSEGGANGASVPTSGTFDDAGNPDMQQLIDLLPVNGPVYRTVTGRPDGGSGVGIEFDGANDYLRNASVNWPQASISAIGGAGGGTLNYNGIVDRGLQFWVKPDTNSVAQTMVMDSNQHGARINSSGQFSMRYDGVDFDSNASAATNTWQHVMVVRNGGGAAGSIMYVDGVGVAAGGLNNDYAADASQLAVGTNTAGDEEFFEGGTEEFFDGVIDDLKIFVIGDNSNNAGPPQGQNWGDFDFAAENEFAAFKLSGVPGDVDNDGSLTAADKTDFVAGWMSENVINGVRVGDINTIKSGDLNFDGLTDIFDLAEMQNALTASGLTTITSAELHGAAVPEPASSIGLLVGSLVAITHSRRRRSGS